MNWTVEKLETEALGLCKKSFNEYSRVALFNTKKILHAFQRCRISEFHFHGTSGYGYNDVGREKLDEVYATVFKTPSALVRPHFVSGTHALGTVLTALLDKGDELLAVMGTPYDTMQSVIGCKGDALGNLISKGVVYREVKCEDEVYSLDKIANAVTANTKVALIQRSRGYSSRMTLTISDIQQIITAIKERNSETICFVDNCYGEFTEEKEPYEVGADIFGGSLIKNPGGGLAPTGGYVAGREELVRLVANQLTAPGLENEMGSYVPGYRLFFQGLFMAPHVVSQALMTAEFAAAVFTLLGYQVLPKVGSKRSDLIQSIFLRNERNMCSFCEGLQRYSPVDGYVRPIPGALPGYVDPVIMACGAFVQGSSIELSADGPIREPYVIYLQGGLTFEHGMLGILGAASNLIEQRSED